MEMTNGIIEEPTAKSLIDLVFSWSIEDVLFK